MARYTNKGIDRQRTRSEKAKTKTSDGDNTKRSDGGSNKAKTEKPGIDSTKTGETKVATVVTKSRYKLTHAWTYGSLKMITNKWIKVMKNQHLILKSTPWKNMVAQVHNLVRIYGAHSKEEIANWNLDYDTVEEKFKSHLPQPEWHRLEYGETDYLPLEFLIRGNPKGLASNPSFVCKVIDRVLRECSNLRLSKKEQTVSWKRILHRKAKGGVFVVFFKVYPIKDEVMYDSDRENKGEYLQMAIVDNEHRSIIPCNYHGTGMVIGQDIEDLCDSKETSSCITDILNRPTTSNYCGLYPSSIYPNRKRKVSVQGMYELLETPAADMCFFDKEEDNESRKGKRKRPTPLYGNHGSESKPAPSA